MIPCVVSPYAFDGSIIRLEQVVEKAKSIGLKSLLLADTNFHGTVTFNNLCRRNGIIPVHGLRVGTKVFYARNREEFEELVKAYNRSEEPKLDFLKIDEIKLIYYLNDSQLDGHIAMCQIQQSPVKSGSSFDGAFEDAALILGCTPYDLRVEMKLPQPKKNWLRSCAELARTPEHRKRFEEELNVIERLGFESYFYTVKRIVDIARSLDVEIGPGRGSAVGSVIAYVLGITKIDPIRYDLLFERFLNEFRKELPDIDIDVEDKKRPLLIESLSQHFPFFALISTFSTLSEKSILNEMNRLKQTPSSKVIELLKGLPIHRSIHAAGVVIAGEPVNLPFVPGSKPFVLEYDMQSLEEIGVTKIDILGLTTLSLLSQMKKNLELHEIPMSDRLTYHTISTGRTLGIFQLEREFARTLCRQIRPESIEELSVLLAMNRPGPLLAKLDRVYARRKRSCDNSERLNLFQDTFDVIIYQEQIMKLAMSLAGMSPAESDLFRMAISQKDRQAMKVAIEQLKAKVIQRGFDISFADHLSNTIEQFCAYAFNKSHSIAYATISYELAYIKTHFPKIFFKYYIDEHASDKKKVFQAIQELRLRGFEVLCPSVNAVEVKENQFQLPLSIITGVGPSVEQMCVAKSPFNSIDDFARKISLPISTIQRLVNAGAFDCIYSSRAESLKAFNSFQKGYDPSLSEISKVFGKLSEQKPLQITEVDIANLEEQVYGFPLTPLVVFLEKRYAPLGEVFCSSRILPVAVKVQSGYASDGMTICKVDEKLSDGEYLIIFGINGKALKFYKLSEAKSVLYEVSGCFDEKDFEEASPNESVKVTLMGKKVFIESARPLTDTYRVLVVN